MRSRVLQITCVPYKLKSNQVDLLLCFKHLIGKFAVKSFDEFLVILFLRQFKLSQIIKEGQNIMFVKRRTERPLVYIPSPHKVHTRFVYIRLRNKSICTPLERTISLLCWKPEWFLPNAS